MSVLIKKLNEKSWADIASIAKNASLADMYNLISSKDVNGFVITSEAFRSFLKQNCTQDLLKELMNSIDRKMFGNLTEIGWWARRIIMTAKIPTDLENEIKTAFKELANQHSIAVEVRSSVIYEELSNQSSIEQHETYQNITKEEELFIAIRNCFASLYTDKAIRYREENGIDHNTVSISIEIQKMPDSKPINSGVFNFQEAVA